MIYHYGFFDPFFGMGHIIGWVLFGLLIVWLLRLGRGRDYWSYKMHKHGMFAGDSAMSILREKYAKGEISKEEFEAKKKDLS